MRLIWLIPCSVLGMKKFVQDYGNAVPTGTIGGNIFVVDGQTYQVRLSLKISG